MIFFESKCIHRGSWWGGWVDPLESHPPTHPTNYLYVTPIGIKSNFPRGQTKLPVAPLQLVFRKGSSTRVFSKKHRKTQCFFNDFFRKPIRHGKNRKKPKHVSVDWWGGWVDPLEISVVFRIENGVKKKLRESRGQFPAPLRGRYYTN